MKKSIFVSALFGFLLAGCATQPMKKEQMDTPENSLPPGNPLPAGMLVPDSLASMDESPPHFKPLSLEQTRKVENDIYTTNYQEYPEVVRYDRYTLVSSSPVGGQKYLLEQLVQVDMLGKKKSYTLSVEQGLWNTLKNTGFTLCSVTSPEVQSLFHHQLPKVHYKFGPMRLREALQMLSGEAYELTVNDTLRQVCFERRAVVPKMVAPQPKIETEFDRSQ